MGSTVDVASMLHYSIYVDVDYYSLLDHKHLGSMFIRNLHLLMELMIITSKYANLEPEILQKEVLKFLI
jgi:hypothetical protein